MDNMDIGRLEKQQQQQPMSWADAAEEAWNDPWQEDQWMQQWDQQEAAVPLSAVDTNCHKCGAWAIMHRSVPAKLLDREKMVGRRAAANRARVVAKKVGSLTAVASLAARARTARAHLDTREKEMGQLKDVEPVVDRISHINARRTMAKRDSRKAGYDHYVGCKQ